MIRVLTSGGVLSRDLFSVSACLFMSHIVHSFYFPTKKKKKRLARGVTEVAFTFNNAWRCTSDSQAIGCSRFGDHQPPGFFGLATTAQH
jgi:hypothetical protein